MSMLSDADLRVLMEGNPRDLEYRLVDRLASARAAARRALQIAELQRDAVRETLGEVISERDAALRRIAALEGALAMVRDSAMQCASRRQPAPSGGGGAMTDTVVDLALLETVARAATPGPWTYQHALTDEEAGMAGGVPARVVAESPDHEDDEEGLLLVVVEDLAECDARHIAAWNPRVALALLERVRQLEEDLAAAREALGLAIRAGRA
jgi:hypothetical protein